MPPRITRNVERTPLTALEALASAEATRRLDAGITDTISAEGLTPTIRNTLERKGFGTNDFILAANEALKKELARRKIVESWTAQGGPGSKLGLPTDIRMSVQSVGGGYHMSFRGGSITVGGDLTSLSTDVGAPCRVTFEGLILHSRQETSPDEIYGSFGFRVGSILVGDRVLSGNFTIPEVQLGGKDKTNTRVWKTSQEFYRGAPVGMELIALISEHDSGDREEVRKRVAEVIDKAAKSVASAMGGAGGTLAQIAATGEQISQGDTGDVLRDLTANLITEVLGLADDPYNPGAVSISAEEMAAPPPVQIAGHKLDSKTIEYTHRMDMSGIDDSGSVGNCSAYFRVWR